MASAGQMCSRAPCYGFLVALFQPFSLLRDRERRSRQPSGYVRGEAGTRPFPPGYAVKIRYTFAEMRDADGQSV
jgi:hypothetical protein